MELQIDRLSDLPENVIETILINLPIRDAVRTSVLSHKWMYKWTTIPELVIHDYSIPPAEDEIVRIDKLVNFIDRLLLLHKGPVRKFDLSTGFLIDSSIDSWIRFLSRNEVKELSLQFQGEKPYKVPYSLFYCQAITCLNLSSCILKPPSVFEGFSVLKSLNLKYVILFDDEDLETLISNCIALERLRLIELVGCTHIKIRGLNLQHFYFSGELTDICFIDAPKLSFVSISIHNSHFEQVGQGESSNLIEVLGSLTGLEKLTIEWYFTQVIQLYENFSFLVFSYFLEFYLISYEDVATELVEDFWEAQGHLDCSMNHLRVVRAYDIGGARPELQFIKFLLVHSPVLETLNVTPRSGKNIDKMTMLEELLRFRRASASAEIIHNRTSED
ncbi:hypothetical protein HHK36_006913 [Tetracentron sinense]|uniref:FBD domain-containing protein n=1 Tax=Tetracentron sinense TaxID=13715 RepID=A0A835DPN1_TETSI|nr:hypothetical protein HHK36_006913 [Tetracentron sinense]